MIEMTCKCCGNPYWYPAEALDPGWIDLPIGEKTLYAYCACDLRICEGPGFNAQPCLYPNYPADQMAEYFKFINQEEKVMFNINGRLVISDKCVAVTSDGAPCNYKYHTTTGAQVYSGVAYDPQALPKERINFEFFEIPVCNTHLKVLDRGKALRVTTEIKLPDNNNPKENAMKTTFIETCPCDPHDGSEVYHCSCNNATDLPVTNQKENTMKNVKLFLLECDQWMCEECWQELSDSYDPYDLPARQWVHCEYEPDRHDPDARCDSCNRTYEDLNTPVPKEDAMKKNLSEFDSALAELEGQPYTKYAMAIEGNFLIEICEHEECQDDHSEIINENRGIMCCGDPDCQHYTTLLCLHHVPNNTKEEAMKTTHKTIKCGYCHEYHNTVDEVAQCGGKTRVAGKELSKNTAFFSTFVQNDIKIGKFWLPNKTIAEECRVFYGIRTFRPAKNGHGFFVFVTTEIVRAKGDFQGLIAKYNATKKS